MFATALASAIACLCRCVRGRFMSTVSSAALLSYSLSRLRRWLTWRAIEIALYWLLVAVAFAVVYLQFIALI